MIFSILAIGLNLLMGYTGLDSLGQAIFFGVAGYTLGILTSRFTVGWGSAALAAIAAGTVVALLVGLVSVRLRGLYFLLVTLAILQVIWGGVIRWGEVTGGANGLSGVPSPATWLRGTVPFYYFTLLAFAIFFGISYLITVSPFGIAIRGIRERELRSATLGYNTYWLKLTAFVVAGVMAAAAGILAASYNRFVSPRDISLDLAFEAMLMVILGGTGTVTGPIIGAFGVTGLRYLLSVYVEDWWLMIMGGVFILSTIYLPEGIMGLARRFRGSSRRVNPTDEAVEGPRSSDRESVTADITEVSGVGWSERSEPAASNLEMGSQPILELRGIGKRFGELAVLDDIGLEIRRGERIGIIGLNGAGKTTLFHVISGIESPTQGHILLAGRDVTKMPAHTRASFGLSRTFQVTLLYPRLTVLENILVALMGWRFRRYQFAMWRRISRLPEVNRHAQELLQRVGLWEIREEEVRYLSYGHQRQLEIALALAGKPTMLLLDEPTAGLSQVEIREMRALIATLPLDLTVLIVEHHLEVIFEYVERVLVLHEGRLIADGTTEETRANDLVRNLYFGIGDTSTATED